jgi:hypothetical protein
VAYSVTQHHCQTVVASTIQQHTKLQTLQMFEPNKRAHLRHRISCCCRMCAAAAAVNKVLKPYCAAFADQALRCFQALPCLPSMGAVYIQEESAYRVATVSTPHMPHMLQT